MPTRISFVIMVALFSLSASAGNWLDLPADAKSWFETVILPHTMSTNMMMLAADIADGWKLPVMAIITAALLFSTFYMQTMVRLRFAAIISNVAFLIYSSVFNLWPSIILHGILLPLNIWRLRQILRTLQHIKSARTDQFDFGKLLPFLRLKKYAAGTVLFSKNDLAEAAYYVVHGQVDLPDIPAEVSDGSLFGEVGIFAGSRRRASSAVCKSDVSLYVLDAATLTTAFYQNPAFAFYLISLISERLYSSQTPKLASTTAVAEPQTP